MPFFWCLCTSSNHSFWRCGELNRDWSPMSSSGARIVPEKSKFDLSPPLSPRWGHLGISENTNKSCVSCGNGLLAAPPTSVGFMARAAIAALAKNLPQALTRQRVQRRTGKLFNLKISSDSYCFCLAVSIFHIRSDKKG